MAYTDREDLNYLGVLYEIGANQTPFVNMMGGINRGTTSKSFRFPLNQRYTLASAAQTVVSEATSAGTLTATTRTRTQEYNVCQIMQGTAGVSFAKQAAIGEFSGIQISGTQPVVDELAFQKEVQLRQIAVNLEYSCLRGTFVDMSVASTAQSTRGIIEAATTCTVAGGSADLTKAMIDELLREMAAAGAPFRNPVIFCNAFQKQMISDIYGFAPQSSSVGGVNVQTVDTDFARMGVSYAPHMPTDTLLIAEMSVCQLVFVPTEGQLILWQDTAITSGQKGGFWMTIVGLDYGPQEFHGTITGLTTA
jgi:hypothetical protein